jgi:hypothetical protein
MTSDGLGEMFEGDSADMCAGISFLLGATVTKITEWVVVGFHIFA